VDDETDRRDWDFSISLGPSRRRPAERRDPPDRQAGLTVVEVRRTGDTNKRSMSPALPIYVSRRACEAAERHAAGDTSREVGGVLLGRYCEGPDGEFVQIEDALPAEAAESRAARITFTHETWARFAQRCEARGDDLQIVGWYHTHPGFGIFLSGHDLFIHRNFFTEPWHVALVIDPVRGDRGFFQWEETRVPAHGRAGGSSVSEEPPRKEAVRPRAIRPRAHGRGAHGRGASPADVAQPPSDAALRQPRAAAPHSLRGVRPVGAWHLFATEEEGDAVRELAGRLERRRAAPAVAPVPTNVQEQVAAMERRLENVRSYVLLVAILGLLILGLNLVLLMNITRVAEQVRDVSRLAERSSPLGRGRDLIAVGRYRAAIDELALARLDETAAAEADYHLHVAYTRLERYDDARSAIRRASRQVPERFGAGHAEFIAADLRRGTPWSVATEHVAATIRRRGLLRATDEADTAAGRIAAAVLDDTDTGVVRTGLRALRRVNGPPEKAALARFVAETSERAKDRFGSGSPGNAAGLMDLARDAAPDDLSVEDAYWYYRYKAGLSDLDEVLAKTRAYDLVAGLAAEVASRRGRRRVVEALGRQGGDRARAVLLTALVGDRESSVREAALEALVAMAGRGDSRAAEAIGRTVMGEMSPRERRDRIRALGRTKQAGAVPALVQVAQSADLPERTRVLAVEALAELGQAGVDVLSRLDVPDGCADVFEAVEDVKPVAAANALYDEAYQRYRADEPEEALGTLNRIEEGVTGDRSVRRLRRDIRRVLAHGHAGGSSLRGEPPRKAAPPAPVCQPLPGVLSAQVPATRPAARASSVAPASCRLRCRRDGGATSTCATAGLARPCTANPLPFGERAGRGARLAWHGDPVTLTPSLSLEGRGGRHGGTRPAVAQVV